MGGEMPGDHWENGGKTLCWTLRRSKTIFPLRMIK
uniref:Uncharacterized protein n=1 Tax=Anguilla anguilla TaxID=7936 RepID=A0A0E9P6J1_ANGAN